MEYRHENLQILTSAANDALEDQLYYDNIIHENMQILTSTANDALEVQQYDIPEPVYNCPSLILQDKVVQVRQSSIIHNYTVT